MPKVLKKASVVKSRRIGRDFGTTLWEDIRNTDQVHLMKGRFPLSIAATMARVERCDVEEFCKAAKAAFKTLQREWRTYDCVE